ncbi:MAG: chemotaxis protein CheC [Methylococcales bacterium]|nr:chemotaxis protein CheC [Methylococcales bacterium]MDD5755137.1 chemotaxis protein CheC [Methylococcales bacterium]
MKTLSELHFNTLSEIINIGTERAVQGLSEVIGESVQSSVPNVELIQLKDSSVLSLRLNAEKFGIVTQKFTGALNADVMLLFAEENVLCIVRNMMGAELDISMVHELENEAMCELGNIMINACLAAITDMLHIMIESSLPGYTIKSREEIVEQIKNSVTQEFVFASHVNFSIEGQPIEGKLFFLLNSSSLRGVVNEIDRYTGVS